MTLEAFTGILRNMTEKGSSYEERLAAAMLSELERWTKLTDGVRYEFVAVDGSYPAGSIVLRFQQDEWPGQQFGLRLRLAEWVAPDELDRRAGEPDPLPVDDVANLICHHLDGHLEVGFFALPEGIQSDKDGVMWLTVDQESDLRPSHI